MNGPSAQALREGGIGGSLRYKSGVTLLVRINGGGPPPPEWKRKTTLQSIFGDFGQVLKIDIPEGQGVAYIEYEDKLDAQEAEREMQGKKICGCAVSVQMMGGSGSLAGRACSTSDLPSRIAAVAREHHLDEAASARLASVFAERARLGCDMNRDIEEISEHLAASNKPSALVSMKLAELRTGQPIGPCKYVQPGSKAAIAAAAAARSRPPPSAGDRGGSRSEDMRHRERRERGPGEASRERVGRSCDDGEEKGGRDRERRGRSRTRSRRRGSAGERRRCRSGSAG